MEVLDDAPTATVEKRDTIESQTRADESLRFVAQPPTIPHMKDVPSYDYLSNGGAGIFLYISDSGANVESKEYRDMDRDRRFGDGWIFAFPELCPRGDGGRPSYTEAYYHGTCVLARAAGPQYGVVKKGQVTIVKRCGPETFASSLESLRLIYNDIAIRGRGGLSVINFSAGFQGNDATDQSVVALKQLVIDFLNLGVVFVCTAGNNGLEPKQRDINTYPALFSLEIPIIVVGGVLSSNGWKMPQFQTGNHRTVSAAGSTVPCPPQQGSDKEEVYTGTSMASPQVAGLAAYFMSDPTLKDQLAVGQKSQDVAKNVRAYIKRKAFHRNVSRGESAVWNGLTPTKPKSV